MLLRGKSQVHPRQSRLGRLFYTLFGYPDLGLQLRSAHVWRALQNRPRPSVLLDLGCGSGRFTLFIAQQWAATAVVGIDIDAAALEAARERQHLAGIGNVTWLNTIENHGQKFDTILALDVLAHTADPEAFGQTISRQLISGGQLYLHTPTGASRSLFARHRDYDYRQNDRQVPFWGKDALTDWLRRHQFTPRCWLTTFRRWGGGTAWEVGQLFTSPFLVPFLNCWARTDGWWPTDGGGILVMAERN